MLAQIQNNFMQIFLTKPFTKIDQRVTLHQNKMTTRAKNRNIFKLHLLNIWPKSKIILRCSLSVIRPSIKIAETVWLGQT